MVLAGGESRRLGSNKALLPLGERRVIEEVVERLQAVLQTVYLVVNDPEPFTYLGLPLVHDEVPHQGPLMGLYSGLLACPTPWALVVACDTPFLEPRLLQGMIEHQRHSPVLMPLVTGEPQPMPALYSKECIPAIRRLIERRRRALRGLVTESQVTLMEEAEVRRLDPELHSFFDVDTMEDYRQAQSLASMTTAGGA